MKKNKSIIPKKEITTTRIFKEIKTKDKTLSLKKVKSKGLSSKKPKQQSYFMELAEMFKKHLVRIIKLNL